MARDITEHQKALVDMVVELDKQVKKMKHGSIVLTITVENHKATDLSLTKNYTEQVDKRGVK